MKFEVSKVRKAVSAALFSSVLAFSANVTAYENVEPTPWVEGETHTEKGDVVIYQGECFLTVQPNASVWEAPTDESWFYKSVPCPGEELPERPEPREDWEPIPWVEGQTEVENGDIVIHEGICYTAANNPNPWETPPDAGDPWFWHETECPTGPIEPPSEITDPVEPIGPSTPHKPTQLPPEGAGGVGAVIGEGGEEGGLVDPVDPVEITDPVEPITPILPGKPTQLPPEGAGGVGAVIGEGGEEGGIIDPKPPLPPKPPDNPATGMTWEGEENKMDPNLPYKGHFNLLNQYAQDHDVKLLLSVGSWAETGGFFAEEAQGSSPIDELGRVFNGGFYNLTIDEETGEINHEAIAVFAKSAAEFVKTYDFDGIDIDDEHPSSMSDAGHPNDWSVSNKHRGKLWDGYMALMEALRNELDKQGEKDQQHYMLTIASPSSGYLLRGFEGFQALQYLDYVNIMSYDLHGTWNHFVEHNAALYDNGNDGEIADAGIYEGGDAKYFNGQGYLNIDWSYKYFRTAGRAYQYRPAVLLARLAGCERRQ
ncbi:glycoside hydrolase family 18 protein [Psychromonas ossibalaenae]|uniref:glycoside hydrolase family 18 protein n=1 Tax=Psychromonas ossibalaenae TaxID=444922 RepID=UPI0003A8A45F|nr:glycosyl hydrolase family 18 protein [Psychromonas ossibalaenae]